MLGRLGAIFGPSCAVLGPSWVHLGPLWGHLGPIWGAKTFKKQWFSYGFCTFLLYNGLRRFFLILECPGAVLGLSWAFFWAVLGRLGASCATLGPS